MIRFRDVEELRAVFDAIEAAEARLAILENRRISA